VVLEDVVLDRVARRVEDDPVYRDIEPEIRRRYLVGLNEAQIELHRGGQPRVAGQNVSELERTASTYSMQGRAVNTLVTLV
jgi:hypothetical protein